MLFWKMNFTRHPYLQVFPGIVLIYKQLLKYGKIAGWKS